MKILIFGTDIKTKKKIDVVKPLFNGHPNISRWTIDTEDIDNVLRIETSGGLSENSIIKLIEARGFQCEELPD